MENMLKKLGFSHNGNAWTRLIGDGHNINVILGDTVQVVATYRDGNRVADNVAYKDAETYIKQTLSEWPGEVSGHPNREAAEREAAKYNLPGIEQAIYQSGAYYYISDEIVDRMLDETKTPYDEGIIAEIYTYHGDAVVVEGCSSSEYANSQELANWHVAVLLDGIRADGDLLVVDEPLVTHLTDLRGVADRALDDDVHRAVIADMVGTDPTLIEEWKQWAPVANITPIWDDNVEWARTLLVEAALDQLPEPYDGNDGQCRRKVIMMASKSMRKKIIAWWSGEGLCDLDGHVRDELLPDDEYGLSSRWAIADAGGVSLDVIVAPTPKLRDVLRTIRDNGYWSDHDLEKARIDILLSEGCIESQDDEEFPWMLNDASLYEYSSLREIYAAKTLLRDHPEEVADFGDLYLTASPSSELTQRLRDLHDGEWPVSEDIDKMIDDISI